MAECQRCGAEARVFFNGAPMCDACWDALNAKPKPIPNDVQLGKLAHECSSSRVRTFSFLQLSQKRTSGSPRPISVSG